MSFFLLHFFLYMYFSSCISFFYYFIDFVFLSLSLSFPLSLSISLLLSLFSLSPACTLQIFWQHCASSSSMDTGCRQESMDNARFCQVGLLCCSNSPSLRCVAIWNTASSRESSRTTFERPQFIWTFCLSLLFSREEPGKFIRTRGGSDVVHELSCEPAMVQIGL